MVLGFSLRKVLKLLIQLLYRIFNYSYFIFLLDSTVLKCRNCSDVSFFYSSYVYFVFPLFRINLTTSLPIILVTIKNHIYFSISVSLISALNFYMFLSFILDLICFFFLVSLSLTLLVILGLSSFTFKSINIPLSNGLTIATSHKF